MDIFFGRLRTITNRQLALNVQFSRPTYSLDQFGWPDLTQYLTCTRGFAHISLNDPTPRLAHTSNRLSSGKMEHIFRLQRVIWLPPAQNRNV